jgi:hypothetical protein
MNREAVTVMSYGRFKRTLFKMAEQLRGQFKVCGLEAVRRYYAILCIAAAHFRQSTNFSNGPRTILF